ncbi:hypothetical protein ACEQPO_18155 [Bacillus sp. SL00103]
MREPVLFIHTMMTIFHASRVSVLYARKKGGKQLFIRRMGLMRCLLAKNKEAYEQEVQAFLQPI